MNRNYLIIGLILMISIISLIILLPTKISESLTSVKLVNSSDNIGIKLIPREFLGMISAQYMYSNQTTSALNNEWFKETKLKLCVSYKSNQTSDNYRSAIIYANSPIINDYEFQIDFYEHLSDYECDKWSNGFGGGTYHISVPFNNSINNNELLHELCINDINTVLNKCVDEWGINESDAYLTDIYQFYVASPTSINEYTIFDYYKLFVNNELKKEFEFNDYSGVKDDLTSDDLTYWQEYYDAYAVSVI